MRFPDAPRFVKLLQAGRWPGIYFLKAGAFSCSRFSLTVTEYLDN